MTNILGIGGSVHDFSACLVKNGNIEYAIEEERLSRIKYHALGRIPNSGMKLKCIEYCLKQANLSIDEIDIIIANDLVFPPMLRGLSNVKRIGHHLSHASHGYFQSDFTQAAILVMDGFGSINSGLAETATYFEGRDIVLRPLCKSKGKVILSDNSFPFSWSNYNYVEDSLGEFYSYITNLLGFGAFEEGKTMGLSAYGSDRLFKKFCEIIPLDPYGNIVFRQFQRIELLNLVHYEIGCSNLVSNFQNFADIAQAAQLFFNLVVLRKVEHVRKLTTSRNLVLSGGIFMNCIVNELLYKLPFDDIYIHGASGDNGTSIGAALFANAQTIGKKEFIQPIIYGGKNYSSEEYLLALDKRASEITWERCVDVSKVAALQISKGKIIGWFQGRSEFGARALGNRSILADPRQKETKNRINSLVKGRELFRPFAPSVILEEANRFFSLPKGSPYMNINSRVLNTKVLPAITHEDGSARVHTVKYADNPLYYKLIQNISKFTEGVSVVLNTSFNENEPIVESPDEAIDCFIRTDLDELFMGDFRIIKI